jgi:hypothetical protein
MFLVDGTMFYCLTVVPDKEATTFAETFQRITASIRLTETR